MAVGRNTPYRTKLYDESPWYGPIRAWLEQLDSNARFPTADELTALHRAHVEARGLPALRFREVPRAKPRRPKGPIDLTTLYEGQVSVRGEVPTRREDWHDLFNALAFLTFPRAKRALHARQFAIAQARLGTSATKLPNARTREQDALTLFDEGGLVVASRTLVGTSDAEVGAALRAGANVVPFGHALYEHMVAGAPCPLATVHVLQLPDPHDADALDRALAEALSAPTAFLVPSPERGVSLPALLPQSP
ncbi:MAG TPA: DUF3025 domain-containing protein [Polyangiales bacterium]|nr:DUF3025 domain-containing protein [Polyangiales bacterium]